MINPNQLTATILKLPQVKLAHVWNKAYNTCDTPHVVSLVAEIAHENLGYFMNKPAGDDEGREMMQRALCEMVTEADVRAHDHRHPQNQAEGRVILKWLEGACLK